MYVTDPKKAEKLTYSYMAAGFLIFILLLVFPDFAAQQYSKISRNHLSLHILLEFSSVFVSFSIALQGWMIFAHTLSKRRLMLAAAFLAIGLLDIFHTLSFTGMPQFIKQSSAESSLWFWITARVTEAFALFALAFIKDEKLERESHRRTAFVISLMYTFILAYVIFFQSDALPRLLAPDGTGTLLKDLIVAGSCTLLVIVATVSIQIYRRTKNVVALNVLLACFFLILCELLTTYQTAVSIHNLMGNIAKVIGYLFIMEGLFFTNVQRPYEELKQQQMQLETLTSSLGEGVMMLDAEGRVVFMNPEAEKLLGWSSEELSNKSLFESIYTRRPDGSVLKQRDFPGFQAILSGRTYRNEDDVFMRKDGTYLPVSYTLAPIFENDKFIGNVGVFRDITERKEAERQLAESEREYRLISENSLDMISKHTPDEQAIFTYVSPACRRLLGYEPEELLGHSSYEFYHPDDVSAVSEDHSGLLQYQEVYDLTFRIRRKDGTYIWFESTAQTVRDEDGNPIEIIAFSRDISDRKRHLEEIEQLSYQNSLILNSVAEGIYGIDKDRNIIFINPAAANMLGYEVYELTGRTTLDTFRHHYKDEYCQIVSTLEDGVIRQADDEVFYRKDGSTIPVEYAVTPIRDKDEIVGAVVTFNDITERIQAEKLLEERQQIDLELSLAANVQQSLLQNVEDVPVPEGTEIGVLSIPIRTLNGDFYTFASDEKSFMFGIADISGKGMPAAILMSMMKFAMDEFIKQDNHPNIMLDVMNRFVDKYSDPTMFVTMLLGTYVKETSCFYYSNAGHEPGILYRASTGEFEDLTTEGAVLGLSTEIPFAVDRVHLEPGDIVLLYTDGLIEEREQSAADNNDILKSLMRTINLNRDAQSIVQELRDLIVEHHGGQVDDDQTLLLFRKQS